MTTVASPQPFDRFVRALLLTPVARAVKRRMRDAKWTVKGRALKNPALPHRVESILFVCLGNICRSPFAARLASAKIRGTALDRLQFESAGIATKQAATPPGEARTVAVSYGVSLDDHRPLLLTESLINRYDLIVVMDAPQLDRVRRTYPDAAGRTHLLSLYDAGASGYERCNIADPFGQPRPAFEAAYARIDRSLTALLDSIGGRVR